jgi:hypothetical protein
MNAAVVANPVPLPALVERLVALESGYLDDVVAPLNTVTMTVTGTIEIPNRGEYGLTEWARHQLSALLGLRWDRYFKSATPLDRQDEINRRLRRAEEVIKLRTARSPGLPIVRAIVSPTYEPIPDTRVAGILVRSMASLRTDLLVSRMQISDRSTSYVIQVGEPQKRGGIVGEIWGGILVKNSDVGWSALSVTAHIVRLACSNGMIAPVADAELVRAAHRHVSQVALQARLRDGFKRLPSALQRAGAILESSVGHEIKDVEAELRAVLKDAGMARRSPNVLAAYQREPHPSVFGVAQALTLAAHDAGPEDRLLLEAVAGQYVGQKSA